MARYVKDPALRAYQGQVEAEVQRVSDLAAGLGYVTYAIRDPSEKDHRGHPKGPIVYVGQSKQLRIRAKDHMADGGRATFDRKCRATRIHAIMKAGCVPYFEILDSQPTLLGSLISETLHARRACWRGYRLANGWPEHQSKEAPDGRNSVPIKRLWSFTVAEALENGIALVIECAPCGVLQSIDLASLDSATRLASIKTLRIKCPGCAKEALRIRFGDTLSAL
jgi:hypothetical protein